MEWAGLLEPFVGEIEPGGQQGIEIQVTMQRWRDIDASTLVGRLQHWIADLLSLGPNSLGIFPPDDAPYAAQVSDQAVLAQSVQPEGGVWTMLMVPEAGRIKAAVEALTRADTWTRATGRIAVLSEPDSTIKSMAANRVTYVATAPLGIQNMRFVAANWFSRHVLAYALGVGLVLLLLSFATSRVLHSFGRSDQ